MFVIVEQRQGTDPAVYGTWPSYFDVKADSLHVRVVPLETVADALAEIESRREVLDEQEHDLEDASDLTYPGATTMPTIRRLMCPRHEEHREDGFEDVFCVRVAAIPGAMKEADTDDTGESTYAILVTPDGESTNRFEDGTSGVHEELKLAARLGAGEGEAFCPFCYAWVEWENITIHPEEVDPPADYVEPLDTIIHDHEMNV